MNQEIFHVALIRDLDKARSSGFYESASLESEGFIHCATKDQLPGVLERYFQDVVDFEIVEIQSHKLDKALQPVFENTSGGTELFPHIYGPIPLFAMQRKSTEKPG